MARNRTWTPAPEHCKSTVTADFADLVRAFRAIVDPYRPELHYMRGPGPKWHAKHDAAPAAVEPASLPSMIRAKAR
jgi:hypothetical protein